MADTHQSAGAPDSRPSSPRGEVDAQFPHSNAEKSDAHSHHSGSGGNANSESDAVDFFQNAEESESTVAASATDLANAEATPGDAAAAPSSAAQRRSPRRHASTTLAELAAHASSAAVLVWKEVDSNHRKALLGAAAMAVASLPTATAHAHGVQFLCDPRTCEALALPETAAQGLRPLMGPDPEYGPSGKRTNGVDLGPECPFTAEVPRELRRMFLVALLAHTIATNRYTPAVRALFQRLSKLLGVSWRLIAACEDALVLRAASAVLQGHKEAKEKSASGNRLLKIAAVGIVGGTAVVLTAGIAAPAVLAGVGVLGAALGGGVAVATGTVVAFFSSAAGGVLLLSLFGAAGTGLGAFRMGRATGGIEVFDLRRLSPRPRRLQAALERQVAHLSARADEAASEESTAAAAAAAAEGDEGGGSTGAAGASASKAAHGGKKSWNPLSWAPSVKMPSVKMPSVKFWGGKGGDEAGTAEAGSSTAEARSAAGGGEGGGAVDAGNMTDTELDMLSDDECVPGEDGTQRAAAAAAARASDGQGAGKNKEQKAQTAAAAKGTAVQSGGLHVFICAAGVATHEGSPDVDYLAPWGGRANRQVQLTADALQWHLQQETGTVNTEGGTVPTAQGVFRTPFWAKQESLTPSAAVNDEAVARRGWLRAQCPYGELYALTWEPEAMVRLGNTISKWLQNLVKDQVVGQILKRTALATLLSAWQLPSTVFWGLSWIDTPFSVAVDRADKAGRVLGHTLLSRAQGSRPVSLVGYSMGARVLFRAAHVIHQRWCDTKDKPLPEGGSGGGSTATGPDGLAWGDACLQLVQDIVLAGAPVSASPGAWAPLRRVASGRVLNAFSSVDFVLIFLYRSNRLAWHVAGVGPVGVTDSKELSEATKRGEGGLEVEVSPREEDQDGTPEGEAGTAAPQVAEDTQEASDAGAAAEGGDVLSRAGHDATRAASAGEADGPAATATAVHASEGASGAGAADEPSIAADEGAPDAVVVEPPRAKGGAGGGSSALQAAIQAGRDLSGRARGTVSSVTSAGGRSSKLGGLQEALAQVQCTWFNGIESWDVTALIGSHLDYAQRMAEICGVLDLDDVPPEHA